MMGGRRRQSLIREATKPSHAVLYLIALSVLGCLVLAMFILQALEIRSLRRELEDLRVAQQEGLAARVILREQLARKDDPEVIEDEVRERLGWVMRGEEKVIFIGAEEE